MGTCIYVWLMSVFTVCLKLSPHCKLAILQYKIKSFKRSKEDCAGSIATSDIDSQHLGKFLVRTILEIEQNTPCPVAFFFFEGDI